MKIVVATIQAGRSKSKECERLTSHYLLRAGLYGPCEGRVFDSEAGFLGWVEKQGGRTPVAAVLMDSRGEMWTSVQVARHIERLRDGGTQMLVVAVGPADGWSSEARGKATLFSLGRITLPHELARVVVAEQVYRALTILAGHPYHSGHA